MFFLYYFLINALPRLAATHIGGQITLMKKSEDQNIQLIAKLETQRSYLLGQIDQKNTQLQESRENLVIFSFFKNFDRNLERKIRFEILIFIPSKLLNLVLTTPIFIAK